MNVQQLEQNNISALLACVELLIYQQKYDMVDPLLMKAKNFSTGKDYFSTYDVYYRAIIFAALGDEKKALETTTSVPEVFSILGNEKKAIDLLKKYVDSEAYYSHYSYLNLLHNPFYNKLRNEPNFIEILKEQRLKYEKKCEKYGDNLF